MYSGLGIAGIITILVLPWDFPVSQWLPRATGWLFVICGVVLASSLIAVLSRKRAVAFGLIGGVIVALLILGILGSIVGMIALFQGFYE